MSQDLRATLRAAAAGGGPALRRGLWLTFLGPYDLEVAASGRADWYYRWAGPKQRPEIRLRPKPIDQISPGTRLVAPQQDPLPDGQRTSR